MCCFACAARASCANLVRKGAWFVKVEAVGYRPQQIDSHRVSRFAVCVDPSAWKREICFPVDLFFGRTRNETKSRGGVPRCGKTLSLEPRCFGIGGEFDPPFLLQQELANAVRRLDDWARRKRHLRPWRPARKLAAPFFRALVARLTAHDLEDFGHLTQSQAQ